MLNNIKKFLHLQTSKMKWIDNLLTEYYYIWYYFHSIDKVKKWKNQIAN